jgi:hypothetical protein
MFAYCNNDPVNRIDTNGLFSIHLSGIREVTIDGAEGDTSTHDAGQGNPKDVPPDHPDYKPPKKGPRKGKNPNGKGWGWVDNKGNIWVWTPNMHGGPGWIVQEPDGGHSHAYPGGGTRSHCDGILDIEILEVFPAISSAPQDYYLPTPMLIGGGGTLLLVMGYLYFNNFGGVRI